MSSSGLTGWSRWRGRSMMFLCPCPVKPGKDRYSSISHPTPGECLADSLSLILWERETSIHSFSPQVHLTGENEESHCCLPIKQSSNIHTSYRWIRANCKSFLFWCQDLKNDILSLILRIYTWEVTFQGFIKTMEFATVEARIGYYIEYNDKIFVKVFENIFVMSRS